MREKDFYGALDSSPFFSNQINFAFPPRAQTRDHFILASQLTARMKIKTSDAGRELFHTVKSIMGQK
jgi:hypothetical protein